MRFNLSDIYNYLTDAISKIRQNSHIIIPTALTTLLITIVACIIVFALSLKGSEKVMVPDVAGKDLSVAMLEMQAKELYPKIQLRYSDKPDDKGVILEQSPAPGAIVKAGRRINLIVSRGAIMERMENYIGQNIDDVRIHLQTLFTSTTTPLIVIKDPPLPKFDTAPAGTILEQDPLPDTPISGPVQIQFVVSNGPESDKVRVPSLIGLPIAKVLKEMEKTEVVFDFTSRAPEASETAGTVVSQIPAEDTLINAWSRVDTVIAMPVHPTDGKVYGIFTETLQEYPYPFQITIEAVTPTGNRYTLVTMKHPGGLLTVPYAVEDGTVLTLTILNKEVGSYEIHATDTASAGDTPE